MGLSYTQFAYSNLRVGSERLAKDGEVAVSVDVKNTGGRDGDEVVQMYVAHIGSAVARPRQELKGFSRVRVRAGETKTVTLPLKASSLAYWSGKGFTVESDTVEVRVGGSSDAIAATVMVEPYAENIVRVSLSPASEARLRGARLWHLGEASRSGWTQRCERDRRTPCGQRG
jgi:hypothetical protein